MGYETVYKYPLTANTEVNLPAVLMMYELVIHNINEENEARDRKQFTNCPLTTNALVNLLAVLVMCELLIFNIIKRNEA